MNSSAPITQGFRVAFRRPTIPLAEISWRWSFAAAAWALGTLFVSEYMDSLPVKTLDRILLRTGQPILVARAFHRIFEGSALRFTEAGILLVIGLTIGWVLLASFGRAATLYSIFEEFGIASGKEWHGGFRALFGLNFLRSAAALSAIVSVGGTLFFASSVWASTRIPAADALRLFSLLLFLVWIAWGALNWFLAVSSVFAADNADSVFNALAQTVLTCWREPAQIFAVSVLFAVMHLVAGGVAFGAGLVTFGAIGALRPGPTILMELLIIAAYLAVADFLYTARLAAYVAIFRSDDLPVIAEPTTKPTNPSRDFVSNVDRDELILSDVPLPAI